MARFRYWRNGYGGARRLNALHLGKVVAQIGDLRLQIEEPLPLCGKTLIQAVAQPSGPKQGNKCNHRDRQDESGRYHHKDLHNSPSIAENSFLMLERA